MAAAFEHTFNSCVRGFHVYEAVWTPTLHECLQTRQELGNPQDRYAVAVFKADTTASRIVGHVPREFSRLFWYMRNNRQQKAVTPTSRGFGDSLLIQVRWKEEAHKKTSQNVFIMRSTVQCFLLCCLVGLQKREKEKVMINVLYYCAKVA